MRLSPGKQNSRCGVKELVLRLLTQQRERQVQVQCGVARGDRPGKGLLRELRTGAVDNHRKMGIPWRLESELVYQKQLAGRVVEQIGAALRESATEIGFKVERETIELRGLCPRCQTTPQEAP